MKYRFGIAFLVPILLAGATPSWALESVGPASEYVLQQLREQKGGEPTAEDLVGALNQITVRLYQEGQYALAETLAREALALGERDLGEEHQQTLAALNNPAALIGSQGRYGEAEPLYVRALEVALARLSREFQGHLAGRGVEWEQVQSALPRGSALLSLRAFNPVDFATGDSGVLHWLAL